MSADPRPSSPPAPRRPVTVDTLAGIQAIDRPRMGFVSATGIGVGAIVGGGILALSGTAFALTGPGAVVAFALNGLIAVLTALSFAELATAFPQSGGPYAFAKRVVSVGAAFGVGWIVWFASIVAAALYASGFAAFALEGMRSLFGFDPPGLRVQTALAVGATLACGAVLARRSGSGGNAVNIGKVVVFGLLILGGLWAWFDEPPQTPRFSPLLPAGAVGLFQAMGATFIALQGFDLIAAVAGEVDEPRRNLPRAMLASLAIALAVYLPLLVVITAVGVADGGSLQAEAAARPDTIVAVAVERYLGPAGYWLVVIAGLLSMLSALVANLFAAARIAQAMGRDRALPPRLRAVHPVRGTPHVAVWVTAVIGAITLLGVSDVTAAGAASSLIFLIAFALAHLLCVVTRARKPDHPGFRVPLWPWLPLFGAAVCGGLALYQASAVPSAGAVTGVWLLAGMAAYLLSFGRRARVFDAAAETSDPDLLELRGRSPLVLVPVANPANAATLARVAAEVAPPRVGRILLFTVLRPPRDLRDTDRSLEQALDDAARTMRAALGETLPVGLRCEGLTTVGSDAWDEIRKAAHSHRCATVLMGLSDLDSEPARRRIEQLANQIDSNLVLLRAPPGFRPRRVRRILVPIGGKGVHNALRARLITGLHRDSEGGGVEVTYLLVVPETTPLPVAEQFQRVHRELVRDEARRVPRTVVVARSDDVIGAIADAADTCDLLVLGLAQTRQGERVIGRISGPIIARTRCPVMLVSARS